MLDQSFVDVRQLKQVLVKALMLNKLIVSTNIIKKSFFIDHTYCILGFLLFGCWLNYLSLRITNFSIIFRSFFCCFEGASSAVELRFVFFIFHFRIIFVFLLFLFFLDFELLGRRWKIYDLCVFVVDMQHISIFDRFANLVCVSTS
jgi:hypothetical protein